MCGIFGLTAPPETFNADELRALVGGLFRLSESRGKESAGLAIRTKRGIRVFKAALAASKLQKHQDFRSFLDQAIVDALGTAPDAIALIGHTRLVTNGSQSIHANNHPVFAGEIVGVHNGIVVNVDDLWCRHQDLTRKAEVDSEVALALLRSHLAETRDWGKALAATYNELKGTASLALLPCDSAALVLASNNGSLYVTRWETPAGDVMVFASEHLILQRFLEDRRLSKHVRKLRPRGVGASGAWIVDLRARRARDFDWSSSPDLPFVPGHVLAIDDVTPDKLRENNSGIAARPVVSSVQLSRYEIDEAPIKQLRRCSHCVLPETVPFISFDERGVCNFCRDYKLHQYKGEVALKERAALLKRNDGRPNVLMTFSGGRDSSFGLHYVVEELGLKPVTFTYDWGVSTDIARRNQARLCGRLGVEQILVSSDIDQKRANIRKNLLAWLKRPSLGMIMLLMAGDKQFFKIANHLARDLELFATVLAANPYEKTLFKAGFCGVPPAPRNHLSGAAQWQLLLYYGKEFALNPRYLNSTLTDSADAFMSFYRIKHDYLRLFDYIPWDEETINRVLLDQYEWELATDSSTTWRIGDATTAFYNYVYYLVAGFTENDTFRSNQIREGVISRTDAISKIEVENRARFDSLLWYFGILGVDPIEVLGAVNRIPRLYPLA